MIIGVVGHVDHGKTEFIKALTGIDTDRLPEEKRRGLSIELGYAFIDLKDRRISIIDVPGHEKFLKNMIRGVKGLDVGILIVSAQEGVMTQTKEHLEILKLMEIKKVIPVVTKIDITEEELVETTVLETEELVKKLHLQSYPVLKVSSTQKIGVEEVKKMIAVITEEIPSPKVEGFPILPVDRVFTLKGVGKVVTGSLINGKLEEGMEICAYPSGNLFRVRGIEVHNERVKEVKLKRRVALNLVGIKKEEIRKGEIISIKGKLFPTSLLYAKLTFVEKVKIGKKPLKVKCYFSTQQVVGMISEIEDGYFRVKLENKATTWFRDKFIVKHFSREKVLAGGVVLDPSPLRRKKRHLRCREKGTLEEIILTECGKGYVSLSAFKKSINTPTEEGEKIIKKGITMGKFFILGPYLLTKENKELLEKKLLLQLELLHKKNPLTYSIEKSALQKSLSLPTEIFNSLVKTTTEILITGTKLRLKKWTPRLTKEEEIEMKKIENLFLNKIDVNIKEVPFKWVNLLVEEGKLIKLGDVIYIHKEFIPKIKKLVIQHFKTNKYLRISDLRQLLNTTRKYAVPLAEYLDKIKFTKRIEDKRILIEKDENS